MSYMRESECKVCGSMFSKSAGGSVFTVCDDCWYTNADKTEHTRITDLESELKAAHDFRVSFQRELGGVIADQDRKIEALEAENARLRGERDEAREALNLISGVLRDKGGDWWNKTD